MKAEAELRQTAYLRGVEAACGRVRHEPPRGGVKNNGLVAVQHLIGHQDLGASIKQILRLNRRQLGSRNSTIWCGKYGFVLVSQ